MTIKKIKPEIEHVSKFSSESIRYLQHGYPCDLVRWHCHEDYELHYIKETRGKTFIGDYIGNFTPNSLFLVGPNLPHNWISEIETGESIELRDRVVNFNSEFITGCTASFPEMGSLDKLWQQAKFGIEFVDKKLVDIASKNLEEIAVSKGFRRLVLFWSLLDLLASSQEIKLLSKSSKHSSTGKKALNQMSEAISYISENYSTNISQEQVAERVNMSNTYFSKVFRKTTGHRFITFVNSCRIDKACELLAHSEEQVTEICFQVGFNNIANFNRQFYSLKNMTPSDYRKSARTVLYQ